MIKNPMPRNIPDYLDRDEVYKILTGDTKALRKKSFNTHLSAEGRRILEDEARHYDVDLTKALEIILRERREARKRKR